MNNLSKEYYEINYAYWDATKAEINISPHDDAALSYWMIYEFANKQDAMKMWEKLF
jgi:hypothetical protein